MSARYLVKHRRSGILLAFEHHLLHCVNAAPAFVNRRVTVRAGTQMALVQIWRLTVFVTETADSRPQRADAYERDALRF